MREDCRLELVALAEDERKEVGPLVEVVLTVFGKALRFAVEVQPIDERRIEHVVSGRRRGHPVVPVFVRSR
jgi:hypothetical protein